MGHKTGIKTAQKYLVPTTKKEGLGWGIELYKNGVQTTVHQKRARFADTR